MYHIHLLQHVSYMNIVLVIFGIGVSLLSDHILFRAEIATFFSVVIIFIFPLLFTSFVKKLWFAVVLNFLTVLCFLGLNEVSRELENPFQNIPNDLPLTTYQAEFNEALVTMYAGFHPDSWWEIIDIDALNFIDPDVVQF
jgi:Bestrophin, RFP-TM, chloride channel